MIDNRIKKTKICRYWKNKKCKFMNNSILCPYAHGNDELCLQNKNSDDNYEKNININKNQNKETIEKLYYDEYSDEIHFYDEESDLYTQNKFIKEMEELIKLIKDEDIKIPDILWEFQINQIKTLKKTFKKYIHD